MTFVAFGAVLLGPALGRMTWDVVFYAVLSLTVVRIVPVALALLGSGARPQTVGFVGWFGPRGLTSIVFAILVLQEAQLPHTDTILLAAYVTVGLSVLLQACPRPAGAALRTLVRDAPARAHGERSRRGSAATRPRYSGRHLRGW